MRRIKLTVAYDGTGYHGWQRQRDARSIEGELYAALGMLLPGERHEILGASRTDAGVHADGNVAVFDTESPIPAERFPMALNRFLPDAVRVREAEEVAADFHPRFVPHQKVYAYHIDRSRIPDPMKRLYSYSFSFPLDIERMRQAAEYLMGEHDFRSFANPDAQVFQHGGDAVRTIDRIEIEDAPELLIRFTGNGFLYHMIRIMVGTLLEVGRGKRMPEDIPRILSARDRCAAGPTAPAKGLHLEALRYTDP